MTTHASKATADEDDKVEVGGTNDSLINSYTYTVATVATTNGGESEEGGDSVEKNPLQWSSIPAGTEYDNVASETDCGMVNTDQFDRLTTAVLDCDLDLFAMRRGLVCLIPFRRPCG